MDLLQQRKYLGTDYTISRFSIDGIYLCEIIEDVVRDLNKDGDLLDDGETKIPKETAIPYSPTGKPYQVILTMSPKFKRLLPLVLGVKHFTGIRMHKMGSKNKPGTAKNSWGCLGLGENKVKGGVINSEKYEMKIIELILAAEKRQEKVWLTIV
jgi:hypothetical protein